MDNRYVEYENGKMESYNRLAHETKMPLEVKENKYSRNSIPKPLPKVHRKVILERKECLHK